MDYVNLPVSGFRVSRMCLGTMTFGEQNSEPEAHEQLSYAVDQGINFIDTAEMYPVPARAQTQGRTESYIGSWLKTQRRESLIVATKAAGPSRGMAWMRGGPQFTRDQLIQACEASLRRLQTDYIDLYQLHWPARNVPMFGDSFFDPGREHAADPTVVEQLSALAELHSAGKIRSIGLSNETPWGVMKFKQEAQLHGLPVISTIQNAFNLINRSFEGGLAEVCYREQVALLAYSPLAFGLLSAKYIDNPAAVGRMSLFPNFGGRYHKPYVTEAVAAYAALAREQGMTPAQLALAWIGSRWYVASTIIGVTTMTQLQENLAAAKVKLSEDVLNRVETIYRRYTNPAQ